MKFDRRKLPFEAMDQLIRVSAEVFRPNEFLGVPVSVYLELNQKFVSVKGPLGLFSPEELDKFKTKGELFVHSFAKRIEAAQKVGSDIRDAQALKISQPMHLIQSADSENQSSQETRVQQPPHPLQLHETSLRLLAQIWGRELWVEPYFLTVLALEMGGPLPIELVKARADQNIDALELALVRASVAVFFALHLGWVDPVWLGRFRERYLASYFGGAWPKFGDQAQLRTLVEKLVPTLDESPIDMKLSRVKIAMLMGKTSLGGRLIGAINKIEQKWLRSSDASQTIFGSDPKNPGLREGRNVS